MTWFFVLFAIVLIFGFVVFRGSPYVPSQKKYIYQAFNELYKVTKKDVLVDIGSGDGVVLRMAARLGARAVGYELNPLLVLISRLSSFGNKKIEIKLADFWIAKIPKNTTVVYVFSVSRDIKNLTKKLQNEVDRIKHSVYLISYGAEFDSLKSLKTVGAYNLYLLKPLQSLKAQV